MMKKVVLILCAVCMLSFAVASPTSTATAGTYTSEMDDVLNVTEWSGVDAGNGLLFMEFKNSYNLPTIGGAKNLDNGLFVAGSLSANFGSWKDTTYNTQTGKASSIRGEKVSSFVINALLGISNWGIKLSADFEPDTVTSEIPSSDPAIKVTTKTGTTSFRVSAGTSVAAGNGTLKPSFGISYYTRSNKVSSNEYPTSDPLYNTVNYDHGFSGVGFFGDILYLTAPKGNIQHQFGATINYSNMKYSDSDYGKSLTAIPSTNAAYSFINVSPTYAFICSPSSNVSFTAKSLLNINSYTYTAKKDKRTDTTISFYEDLGAFYKTSDRFQLNGGVIISCSSNTMKNLYDGKTEDKSTSFGTTGGSGTSRYLYNKAFDTTPYFGAAFNVTPNLKAEVSVMNSTSIAITYKF